jgi:hypothetical protein
MRLRDGEPFSRKVSTLLGTIHVARPSVPKNT